MIYEKKSYFFLLSPLYFVVLHFSFRSLYRAAIFLRHRSDKNFVLKIYMASQMTKKKNHGSIKETREVDHTTKVFHSMLKYWRAGKGESNAWYFGKRFICETGEKMKKNISASNTHIVRINERHKHINSKYVSHLWVFNIVVYVQWFLFCFFPSPPYAHSSYSLYTFTRLYRQFCSLWCLLTFRLSAASFVFVDVLSLFSGFP